MTDAERTREAWLLAGQSNMIGYGPKGSELGPGWWASPPHVALHTGTVWAPLLPAEASFGPEIGFGHVMAAARPEVALLLIKPLFGLGSLQDDWRSPDTGRGPAGPHYRALAHLVQQAMAAEPAAKIVGMLWMQGEADAHNDLTKATAYERNLALFIRRLRKDLAVPDMRFLIGQITTSQTWVHNTIVREAQEKVAASVPRTAVFDTDDLQLCDDGIHYNTTGALDLGQRFARAALAMEQTKEPV